MQRDLLQVYTHLSVAPIPSIFTGSVTPWSKEGTGDEDLAGFFESFSTVWNTMFAVPILPTISNDISVKI